MSRVDVPTLMCDRCNNTTQDIREMGRYATLRHSNMGGEVSWDLCPDCWSDFKDFISKDSNG